MTFDRVLVAGAGQMGAGIAQVVAASGREVLLYDSVPGAVERGRRDDGAEPREAPREGRPAAGRRALGRVTPVEELVDADLLIEAIVEHAETKKQLFRAADAAMSAGGRARLEHVVDPDHGAGRRHGTARAGGRDALLQPGARPRARRGDPGRADLRRDGGGDRRACARPREDAGRGERLPRLRLEPDPDAVPQRGRVRADGGRRRAGGDRHGREARVRAPDGPARARRPDRARHVRRDHGGAARGSRRSEVRAVPAPAPLRRRRASGP